MAYVARKTMREFSKDQCADLATALTYYAVLALFPAVIAALSLISVFGQGTKTVNTILGILSDVGAGSVADTLRPILVQLSQGAGLALVAGLLGTLNLGTVQVRWQGTGLDIPRCHEMHGT